MFRSDLPTSCKFFKRKNAGAEDVGIQKVIDFANCVEYENTEKFD